MVDEFFQAWKLAIYYHKILKKPVYVLKDKDEYFPYVIEGDTDRKSHFPTVSQIYFPIVARTSNYES